MINWEFNEKDFKINENTIIPEGDHRVMVRKVTIKTYSTGNEGFEIMLDVSGCSGKLWHRIIMDPNNPEKTNHNIGKFFESFGITNYDLNCYESWVGKDGAVRVKHDTYNGSMTAKVLFCITRAYQDKLPAWREPTNIKSEPKKNNEHDPMYNTVSTFNEPPTMPNEHTATRPPIRQLKFEGFSF